MWITIKRYFFASLPSHIRVLDTALGRSSKRGIAMSGPLRHVGAAALLLISGAQMTTAQEAVERNPFSTPPIQEVIQAADKDRVARITGELVEAQLAAIEQRIVSDVESRIAAIVEDQLNDFQGEVNETVNDRLSEMDSVISSLRGEVSQQIQRAIAQGVQDGSSDAAEMGLIPEGSAFVACVDGRSLYRDANGSTFYMDNLTGDAGVSRCSN